MSWTQQVYSEMATEVGYDSDTQEMLVTWKRSGKTTAYSGVPEDKALECANAASVGSFINSEIKPYYQFRYV